MNTVSIHLSILALELAVAIAWFLWFENAILRAKRICKRAGEQVEKSLRLLGDIMRARK